MFQRMLVWGLVLGGGGLLAWFGLIGREKFLYEQMELYRQPEPMDPREIHYVPTPPPVVAKMLAMANLSGSDIVLDLGCGDGRLVIEAAKQFGCRGRGYDIDPELIELCEQNAREAGVEHLVDFYIQDIYEVDISDATVVMLYLLPEMNLRLLPQLQSMADTARVITHDFELPGVQIVEEAKVQNDTGPNYMHISHRIFLYHAPFLFDLDYQPEGKKMVEAVEYVLQRRVLTRNGPTEKSEVEQSAGEPTNADGGS